MTSSPPDVQLPLALTSGEPAGIGPDLCIALAASGQLGFCTVLGDTDMLGARAAMLGHDIEFRTGRLETPCPAGVMHVTPLPLAVSSTPGQLDPANARYVLELLDMAVAGCSHGRFAGIVTAPVHKGIINDAGIPFSGHTEYLAEKTNTPRVVMLLAAGTLRVALATTHLPLREVTDAIDRNSLRETLLILEADLRKRFSIARPRILVLGLNPHAGEGGHLGSEEREIIAPVIDALVSEGLDLHGPLPADTAFTPRWLGGADAVLAMYHDQGLPVLKYAGFGQAVNVTLGLPLVRTSVDHGTALDLAGTGRANADSLLAALTMARQLSVAG